MAEAGAAPVDGWGFGWLDGRATEQRPSWGYAGMLVHRVSTVEAVLDIQTGGGEVFSEVLRRSTRAPLRVEATEAWLPNLVIARSNLAPFGATVAEVAIDEPLPFEEASFDLVISRHPVLTLWPEVARVLRPGGTFFSQQVGDGSNRELYEFLMGPQPPDGPSSRSPRQAERDAANAGLAVTDLREEPLLTTFNDIGAVVYFLRKVPWTVPDFSVEGYLPRLRALHEQIACHGPFQAHAQRFLIEAQKPPAH